MHVYGCIHTYTFLLLHVCFDQSSFYIDKVRDNGHNRSKPLQPQQLDVLISCMLLCETHWITMLTTIAKFTTQPTSYRAPSERAFKNKASSCCSADTSESSPRTRLAHSCRGTPTRLEPLLSTCMRAYNWDAHPLSRSWEGILRVLGMSDASIWERTCRKYVQAHFSGYVMLGRFQWLWTVNSLRTVH